MENNSSGDYTVKAEINENNEIKVEDEMKMNNCPEDMRKNINHKEMDMNIYPGEIRMKIHPEQNKINIHPDEMKMTIRPDVIKMNIHPEEMRMNIHPEQKNIHSVAMNIYPEEMVMNIHSEGIKMNFHPEQKVRNIHPEEMKLNIYPEQNKMNINPNEMRKNIHLEEMKMNIYPDEMKMNIHPDEMRMNIDHEQKEMNINHEERKTNIFPAENKIDICHEEIRMNIHPEQEKMSIHPEENNMNFHPVENLNFHPEGKNININPEVIKKSIDSEEKEMNIYPEENNMNIHPEIRKNVDPEEKNMTIHPEENNMNIHPEIRKNVDPEEKNMTIHPEENMNIHSEEKKMIIQTEEKNINIHLEENNVNIHPEEMCEAIFSPEQMLEVKMESGQVLEGDVQQQLVQNIDGTNALDCMGFLNNEALKERIRASLVDLPTTSKEFQNMLPSGEPRNNRDFYIPVTQNLEENLSLAFHLVQKNKYTKKDVRKRLLQSGKEYINSRGKVVPEKKYIHKDCNCRLKCEQKLTSLERENIFDQFWALGNWELQSVYIISNIKVFGIKRRTTATPNNRDFHRKYYLNDVQVCKNTFQWSLGISNHRLEYALKVKFKDGYITPDKRGGHPSNKTPEATRTNILSFLNSYPKFQCDYSDNSKVYFHPEVTVKQLHDLYTENNLANNLENCNVSYRIFLNLFNSFNFRIYNPKKDTNQERH